MRYGKTCLRAVMAAGALLVAAGEAGAQEWLRWEDTPLAEQRDPSKLAPEPEAGQQVTPEEAPVTSPLRTLSKFAKVSTPAPAATRVPLQAKRTDLPPPTAALPVTRASTSRPDPASLRIEPEADPIAQPLIGMPRVKEPEQAARTVAPPAPQSRSANTEAQRILPPTVRSPRVAEPLQLAKLEIAPKAVVPPEPARAPQRVNLDHPVIPDPAIDRPAIGPTVTVYETPPDALLADASGTAAAHSGETCVQLHCNPLQDEELLRLVAPSSTSPERHDEIHTLMKRVRLQDLGKAP